MAIKQRNVVLVSRDVDGNTCMDMPLTCIDQVEGMDEFIASYIASQEEALAGVLNTKIMTPFLVKLVIDAATSLACPTGMIGFFALKSVPPGWLICNGSAVSRTTYAKLFSIWGTTWGEGDGETTFNLPNLDGRFLEGTTDIAKVGQYVEAGLPNITGNAGFGDAYLGNTGISGAFYVGSTAYCITGYQKGNNKSVALDSSRSSSIYGQTSTVQPHALRALPCIKV